MLSVTFSPTQIGLSVLFGIGVLCAVILRKMSAGAARGWTKLASFLAIGISSLLYGVNDIHAENMRSITTSTITGILVNLHTVTGSYRSSPVLHFNIDTRVQNARPELHGGDGLFFMKAQDGEWVEATFNEETGYVSHLQILDGPHIGFHFDNPDVPNTMPGFACVIAGVIIIVVGSFKWIVDHNADPVLAG